MRNFINTRRNYLCMTHAHDIIQRLQASPTFTQQDMTGYTLANIYNMLSPQTDGVWQVGYYNAEKEQLRTFHMASTITVQDHTEMVKAPDHHIMPVDITTVSLSWEQAQAIAQEFVLQTLSVPTTPTQIYILQRLPIVGTVWNVTMVSSDFKTVNVKIDASTGEIKLKSINSLLDMQQKPDEDELE